MARLRARGCTSPSPVPPPHATTLWRRAIGVSGLSWPLGASALEARRRSRRPSSRCWRASSYAGPAARGPLLLRPSFPAHSRACFRYSGRSEHGRCHRLECVKSERPMRCMFHTPLSATRRTRRQRVSTRGDGASTDTAQRRRRLRLLLKEVVRRICSRRHRGRFWLHFCVLVVFKLLQPTLKTC